MKKTLITLCAIAMLAIIASSCAHKTCPAYRGSIAETVVTE